MHGAGHSYGSVNVTGVYSPITLSYEWPTVSRLLFVVLCSCLGTTINGFFVASFFVEHTLKRVGNVFLACVGLSDLIVTTAVLPVSAVVLLSAGEWDTLGVCRSLQFLTELATYSYSLFFVLVSIENYYRLCRPAPEYANFISMRVGLVAVLVFLLSAIMAGMGVYLHLDYDYCERRQYGNFNYRVTTSVVFHAIPSIITIFSLTIASAYIRRRASQHLYYRRSQQYERDLSITNLNLTAYLIYIIMWAPYLIVSHEYSTGDSKFYHCVWIGVSRSIFSSFLYSSMNRNFRRAFAHLFYYCCCKSTLSGSFNNRHRRSLEFRKTGDVRVHIMHQVVNPANPQRGASTSRETQEL